MADMAEERPVWETYEFVDYSDRIGSISDEQVAQYRRDGFLYVKDFIDPALCQEALGHIKDWCGIKWDEWPEDPVEQEQFRDAATKLLEISPVTGQPSKIYRIRQDKPWLFNFLTQPKLGEASARLIGVPAVKLLSETNHAKLPESSGKSVRIFWHQDGPNVPIDRMLMVQTWIALASLTAEMGCMTYMKGSHETPLLGMLGYARETAEEKYPWLWDKYEITQPHDMNQGDVMFHHPQMWHASSSNPTNRVRWGMSSVRIDADCLYTGQQCWPTDNWGLVANKHFDHPNFPTVYDSRKQN